MLSSKFVFMIVTKDLSKANTVVGCITTIIIYPKK